MKAGKEVKDWKERGGLKMLGKERIEKEMEEKRREGDKITNRKESTESKKMKKGK